MERSTKSKAGDKPKHISTPTGNNHHSADSSEEQLTSVGKSLGQGNHAPLSHANILHLQRTIGNQATLQLLKAQPNIQRVVDVRGQFDNMDVSHQPMRIQLRKQRFKDAYNLFEQGAGALLNEFNADNVNLLIETDPHLPVLGRTSYYVGDGRRYNFGDNPNLWIPELRNGSPFQIVIRVRDQVNDPGLGTKERIAHTLNHEFSIHAIHNLNLVKRIKNASTLGEAVQIEAEESSIGGLAHGPTNHARLAAFATGNDMKDSGLKWIHDNMMALLNDGGKQRLQADFNKDVADHQHFLTPAVMQAFKDKNPQFFDDFYEALAGNEDDYSGNEGYSDDGGYDDGDLDPIVEKWKGKLNL